MWQVLVQFDKLAQTQLALPCNPISEVCKASHGLIVLGAPQTSEQEMHKKELGSKGASEEEVKGLSEEILYKIDIPANRYDMLCLEGISRALNIFNRRIPRVDYRLANMAGKPFPNQGRK